MDDRRFFVIVSSGCICYETDSLVVKNYKKVGCVRSEKEARDWLAYKIEIAGD